jgi:RimJ/RimL family protein N-acetyltransferase
MTNSMPYPEGDAEAAAFSSATPADDADRDVNRAERFAVPSLRGRHVYLRPLTPQDYGFLHATEVSGEIGPRWRFRGSTPSPEQWAQATWGDVLAQFLVVNKRNDAPVGIVAAHRPNFQDGHAQLSAAKFKPEERTAAMMLGLAIFLQYVFSCWDFRKLYMEVPEYNYSQLASGVGRFFVLEGQLRRHSFFAGRFWDQMTLAIYRETWVERGGAVVGLELRQ